MAIKQYLTDDAIECEATVVDKIDGGAPILRLDRTIFYPNSLAQRADRGTINRASVLAVEVNGSEIDHYIDNTESIEIGDTIFIRLDSSWRHMQSAYHSAGHLIVYALEAIKPECRALIGQHWPDQATITCYGNSELSSTEVNKVNDELQAIIERNLDREILYHHQRRLVQFGQFRPLTCNGTHLSNTGQLRSVRIHRAEYDGEHVKVYYRAYTL